MIVCKNPIIPGFAPDPSICRVGNDYYLVNSTFAYFPGVPIFHSRNLADWEQIGNVLDRTSQLPLKGCRHSEGIYAPTIRYHDGTFYMITTNVSGGGNFLVTASCPQGPWSEPYYLGEAAKGIDSSLFFDRDGTCYYIGQRENSAGCRYFGDGEIWIQELNLQKMQLVGEAVTVLHGFQKNATWAEGPHLYFKDGYYYIIHAEGGTGFHHCIVAARSRSVFGPYEYNPCNPILTHRHLGTAYPVTCVGHGDLVEDGDGNWYMVMLACRPRQGYTPMGRETFLAKVFWEDGWPVVNPGIGKLEDHVELPGTDADRKISKETEKIYSFSGEKLPPQFVMLRNPEEGTVSLTEHPGSLRLYMRPETLKEQASPAYVAVRQRDGNYRVEAALTLHFRSAGDCAGLAILNSNENHVRVELFSGTDGKMAVRVISCANKKDIVLVIMDMKQKADAEPTADTEQMKDAEPMVFDLRLDVRGPEAAVFLKRQNVWENVLSGIDLRNLSGDEEGRFTGCTAGMYASSNGEPGGGYADFSRFSYTSL